MAMTLKQKPNYLNGSIQKSQDRKKTRMQKVRSYVMGLLTVFLVYNSMVHHGFLPQDHTVNKEYYLEVMCRLREAAETHRIVGKQIMDFPP